MVKHCLTIYDECNDAWERVRFRIHSGEKTSPLQLQIVKFQMIYFNGFRRKQRNWPYLKNVIHQIYTKVVHC